MFRRKLVLSCYRRSSPRRFLSFSLPTPRTLDQVADVDKLLQEKPEDIDKIWRAYHSDKNHCLATTLDAATHNYILAEAKKSSMFIFPVMKEGGYMWMLSQFQDQLFLLTYLEEFKSNPGNAQPWYCLNFYPDLLQSKKLGLQRSDFLPNLNSEDAHMLTKLIVKSYQDPEARKMISTFNHKPELFDVDACLQAMQRIAGEVKDGGRV